jgi:hypothetical protein
VKSLLSKTIVCIIDVASNGSTNPEARPTAITFLFNTVEKQPGSKLNDPLSFLG